MNILLTGAFGNIGISTLKALSGRGHRIRCFDLPSEPIDGLH
jgi:nucleoside-diphosphate-sugar epimerase